MINLMKAIFFLFLLIISPAGVDTCTAADANTGIKWYSYADGVKKIKADGKMGFLHFYTDWCTYCTIMNNQTFSDKQVAEFLNDKFIPIRVNAEQEKAVAKEYGVYQFPSTWFLSNSGEPIANRPGFIPPDMMIVMLKYLHSGSFKTTSFQDFVESQK